MADTGLRDSNGAPIHIGDFVKKPVDCNHEVHGEWAIYEVRTQGVVPILSYVRSEKGQVLPEGYTGSVLSDEYDGKMFVFATDSTVLRPMDELEVVAGFRR